MESQIAKMFAAIDNKNHDALDQFFDVDIVYERPGFPDVCGFSDILDFYKNRRPIESGKHYMNAVIASGDQAVSIGRFVGVLKDGSLADERFSDFYKFKGKKIIHRTTYFFRPAI